MTSIRRNGAYRGDPYLAKSVENIAGLFAPPSGSDAAGWANAAATRANAQRIAELYAGAAGDADRQAVMTGIYTPIQSYRALDMNNATTRRGQDLVASTSRSNNAADNERALEQTRLMEAGLATRNEADNRTKIDTNANTVKGSTIASLFGALNPGQTRPEVPAEIAGTIGLPQISPAQGIAPKMTESEVKGAERTDLRNRGVLTDQMLTDAIMGEKAPVQVVGPNGKPVYATPGGAVGQEAFNAPSSAKASNGQFVLADGSRGAAVQDNASGRWRNAQTGQDLPADAQITNMPTPQGSNADIGVDKSVANNIDKQMLDLAVAKDTAVTLRDMIAKSPAAQGVVGWLRGTAQNVLQTGGELGTYFGGQMAEIDKAIRNGAVDAKLAGAFDPNIPAIDMMANLLAFQYAKTTTGERLSNEMLKNARTALGLDGLDANQANSLARIGQAINRIEAQQGILTRARSGGVASVSGAAPPAPTAAAPAAAPAGRMRFDAEGNPL